LTLDNVDQFLLECEDRGRNDLLLEIIRKVSIKTCLMFLNSKSELDSTHQFLTSKGYKAHVLAADRTSDEVREEIIEKVRRGEVKVLLTTNLLSRGVDLRHINIVINTNPPIGEGRTVDFHTYLHRVGRTGRFGRRGVAVNIASSPAIRELYAQIERYFNKPFLIGSIDEIAASLEKVNEDYSI
jgi:Superfamily II DNA and RNA helicases